MLNVSDQVIGEKLPQSPKSAELLSNLSGVMINTDFVLDYPRAQPPNFINVGGLQIKADPGTIPSDMLSFINSAPEGVLLFTMGFIFNAKVNHILFTKKKLDTLRRVAILHPGIPGFQFVVYLEKI